jgi:hypothetical protein
MMQANEGEGLTARQRRAVLALLEAPSAEAAAAAVGVASSTLWRWRQTPAFQRALQDARRAAFGKALDRLAATAVTAAETLARNLSCGTPAVEVSAARALLEQIRTAIEVEDLAQRVERLEEALNGTHTDALPRAPAGPAGEEGWPRGGD